MQNVKRNLVIIFISSIMLLALLAAFAFLVSGIKNKAGDFSNNRIAESPSLSPTPSLTPLPTPLAAASTLEIDNKPTTEPNTPPPSPTPTPEPTYLPVKDETGTESASFKFSDKFTPEEIITETSYSAPDMAYNWEKFTDETNFSGPVTYYVADIYVADATLIKTGFSSGSYKKMAYKPMEEISASVQAVLAVSGDFAHFRDDGLVIRNGEVCRTSLDNARDIGVLYKDGTFKTYLAKHVPLKEILASDPWQCWCFGPSLLDENGHAKQKFNTNVSILNPRAVFGYYEPRHYCFVVVDGREKAGGSVGLTMQELSMLMESLGCSAAINLDGGSTAQMAWESKVINEPFKDRLLHDIIYLGRTETESESPTIENSIIASEPLFTSSFRKSGE